MAKLALDEYGLLGTSAKITKQVGSIESVSRFLFS